MKTGLRAALDHRITNRHVFRLGLRGLPGSNKARRVVLPDADVLRIVNAAYEVRQLQGLTCSRLPLDAIVETLA